MNTFKTSVAFGVVMAGGYGIALLAEHFFASDAVSAILISIGSLAAVSTGFCFHVLRRLDEPPIKQLSAQGAERLRRVYDNRRKRFQVEWGTAVFSGFVAAVCGGLMKVSSLAAHSIWLGRCGFVALSLALVLGFLIVLQFAALSKVARDLPKQLEDEEKRNALLRRLNPERPVS